VVLPLTRAGDWRCINVHIDGKDAGWFVIDTGASSTVIDKPFVKELGLRHVVDLPYHTGTSSANSELFSYGQLVIGPVSCTRGIASALDLSSLSVKAGFKIGGILGNDLLREQPFAIDFPASTLTLFSNRSFVPPAGVEPQSLSIRGIFPCVHGSVEGVDGWFIVDTGSNSGLELDPRFLMQQGLRPPKHRATAGAEGLGGAMTVYTDVVGPLAVLGKKREEQRVTFKETEFWPNLGLAGSVSAADMSEGRFTFDYSTGRLWVEWQKSESAEQMIRRLGDPKGKDLTGRTPMMTAADLGRTDVVRGLSKLGADVNATDAMERTPLMYAATNGHTETVKALLAAGADPKRTGVWMSLTALHMAASQGDVDSVRAILAAGADRDARDSFQGTPLMCAAYASYPDVVQALLDAGAGVNLANKFGQTPLALAAMSDDLAVVKALVAHGAQVSADGPSPLMSAASWDNIRVTEFLLGAGAKIDATDATGQTALMWAARDGREAAVQLLLNSGADPARRSSEGKAAVDYTKDPYIIRMLLVAPTPAKSNPSTAPIIK
jgi:ankyrin repeat protein